MKQTLALLLLVMSTCGMISHAQSPLDDFSISLTFADVRNRDALQEGGIETNPAFKRYRLASERVITALEYQAHEKVMVAFLIGRADLRTHASEGETAEFATAWAMGGAVQVLLLDLSQQDLQVFAAARMLFFRPSDAVVTRALDTPALRTGGDLTVNWSEIEFSTGLRKQLKNATAVVGARSMAISADQKRIFSGGTGYDSSFEQDDSVGLFLAATATLSRYISVFGQINFVDETKFSSGIRLDF